MLDASCFRALVKTNNTAASGPDFVSQIKEKLDDLVSLEGWECEDIIPKHKSDGGHVTDCIIYYVTGFLCRKMRRVSSCPTCLSAFSVESNSSAEADLTNVKTRGGLTHPNAHIFHLLKHTERFFVDYADFHTVYWDTIDAVIDTYTMTFPCADHKEEVIAQLLHYYVSMRMRQHCKHVNAMMTKQSQEKKKQAKLCAS